MRFPPRPQARSRELARQRYWAWRPTADTLFATVRQSLAALDRCVALLYTPADDCAAADAEAEWEEVPSAPSAAAHEAAAAPEAVPRDGEDDAAVREALRSVLADLAARMPDVRIAVAELSCTAVDDAARPAMLAEALALKAATEVALRRYGAAQNTHPQQRHEQSVAS